MKLSYILKNLWVQLTNNRTIQNFNCTDHWYENVLTLSSNRFACGYIEHCLNANPVKYYMLINIIEIKSHRNETRLKQIMNNDEQWWFRRVT